ncbi:MAG: TlpA disulfide reductase family protein [Bacteroidota bacterium]|nr:TlpA disulfide reductase family protein [Bacteroidota bacterium]
MNKKYIILIVIMVLGLTGFYFYKKYNIPPSINFNQLELYNLQSEKINFNDFKGKKILVSFGASWCPNCIEELNTLKGLKDTKLPDVEIICISDESIEKIVDWKERKKYPFTFLKLNTSFNAINIFSIPTSYVVNTKLEVVKEKVGYIDWEDQSTLEHYKKLME